MIEQSREEILTVSNLSKTFRANKSFITNFLSKTQDNDVRALRGVNFSVFRGETLGILGESGSGKSTLARVLMGIYPPDCGEASLNGQDLFYNLIHNRLLAYSQIQMIFQDPFGSLDPRMNVKQIIIEPLKIHKKSIPSDQELGGYLTEVGLDPMALYRYPGEFSGGQRQRIGICRAMILSPELVIADEAVSALDVSVQAQILKLLIELKKKRNMSMIFISHDVAVVRQISDRVLLFYRGDLVEQLPADCLIKDAAHPYTKRLLNSALYLREGSEYKKTNTTTDYLITEQSCCFISECPIATDICKVRPEMKKLHDQHFVACCNC